MPFPNHPEKYAAASHFTPHDFWKYQKKLGRYPTGPIPECLILCYQSSLLKYVQETQPVQKMDEFGYEVYLLTETGNKVGVAANFGIGAPVAAAILEEWAALGVKTFLSMGTTGTLQKHIDIGDLIICDKALRDEGVSHHYLPSESFAYPAPAMVSALTQAFQQADTPFHLGGAWTTDAPYRETAVEICRYRDEGILCVEMEAAALFAVAQYLQVEIGALFTVSDSLAEENWKPRFAHRKTTQGLETLFHLAVDVLQGRCLDHGRE